MKAKKEKKVKSVSLQTIIGAAKILAIKPKKGTKVVKAWAVIGASAIRKDKAFQYIFEKEEGIKPQTTFLVFPTKGAARKWMNKWHSISGHTIVPVTITYTPPGTLT